MSIPPGKVVVVCLLTISAVPMQVLMAKMLPEAVQDCEDVIDSLNITCPTDQPNTPVLYPDPLHCSRYWECYNGCATNFLCEQDYLYDDVHKYCNFPDKVICGDRPCDGRPCAPEVDFECPDPNGFHIYPDPDNCIKYYECADGLPFRQICPKAPNGEQEYFKEGDNWCDYPSNVNCGDRPVCDENDENCHDVTGPPTQPPSVCDSILCSEMQNDPESCVDTNGILFWPEGPCHNCFCECGPGSTYGKELCCSSADLYFDNKVACACDWKTNCS